MTTKRRKKPHATATAHVQQVPLTLLVKLGSIAVHADELLSPDGHPFDAEVTLALVRDPQVREWIKSMGALLPVKRR